MKQASATPLFLSPNAGIPNNPDLPLLLYRQVFPAGNDLENRFEKAFRENNWAGIWTNGVFSYHHYHSLAHEVLGVAAGSVTLIFGGPGGQEIEVTAGDMVVLPAGTGHCRKQATPDFSVVGAYPQGQQDYDICTEADNVAEKVNNIAKVPLPQADPVAGNQGYLLQYWH